MRTILIFSITLFLSNCAVSEMGKAYYDTQSDERSKHKALINAENEYTILLENLERQPADTGLFRMRQEQRKSLDSLEQIWQFSLTQKREFLKKWELDISEKKTEFYNIKLIEDDTQQRLDTQKKKIQESLDRFGQ